MCSANTPRLEASWWTRLGCAARATNPESKGVSYVRANLFAGEQFRDLGDCRARATLWCREITGMRVHGTTEVDLHLAARLAIDNRHRRSSAAEPQFRCGVTV